MKRRNLIVSILIILIGVFIVCGQSSATLSRTPGSPAGSYKLGEFDTVNLFSGNLNFNLPLLNTGGRGESGADLSLTIENQWSISPNGVTPSGIESFQIQNHLVSQLNGAGHLRSDGEIKQTSENCIDNYPYYWVIHNLRLTFVEPNGTEHILVDPETFGLDKWQCDSYNPINYGKFFQSVDGTFATFISDSDVIGGNLGGATGYLMLKSGMKYRIENGKAIWSKDRNGNLTEYTYDTSTAHNFPNGIPRPTKIKDSIGREINIQYGVTESSPYGLCNKITFKGTNGQERVIRISLGASARTLKSNTDDELALISLVTTDPNDSPQVSATIYDWTRLPKAVWLPDGRSYEFLYNTNGRLAQVKLPTGGSFEYDFYPSVPQFPYNWDYFVNRVKEKRIYDENNILQSKTVFSETTNGAAPAPPDCPSNYPSCGLQTIITVENLDASNNLIGKSKHYFHGHAVSVPGGYLNTSLNPLAVYNGKEWKTEALASNGITVLTKIEKTWRSLIPSGCYVDIPVYNSCGLPYPRIPNSIPVDVETKTTLVDNNLVSLVTAINPNSQTYSYDQFHNPTDVYEYDYGIGAPGQFLRRTHTDYVTDTNYTARTGAHLRGLPLQAWVSSDINGTTKTSLTQFEYDNYSGGGNNAALDSRSNVVGHDTTNYGSNNTKRGNVTKVTSYGNAQNQTELVSIYTNYDILGNIVKTIDAKGNVSTIDYTDRFGTADGEAQSNMPPIQLNGQNTFAFPTSVINAVGWITGYSQVDYFTGQSVDTEDLNGVVNSTFYNDPLDRLTQTISANNLPAFKRQTNIIYDDANRRVESKSDLNVFNDNLLKSESFYDGLGRTIESRKHEQDGGYVMTKSIPFAVVQDAETNIWRVAIKQSNPYRPLANEQPVWTTSLSDELGRAIKTITPDGAMVKTAYSGNIVTVTDQAGKQRRSITNVLGQLTRVDEPDSSSNLGTVSAPTQPTNYSYDTLNNLTAVNQGVQTRSFVYDSLSRLKSATNPESGLISYQYDNNGNLTKKTDARLVETNYQYDALNRVIQRNYQNEPAGQTATPAVIYSYDNLPNAKGKLIKVTNGTLTNGVISNPLLVTEYEAFDILGRVTQSQQWVDGVSYGEPMTYTYNLSGAMIEQKYPSGRVVKNVLDQDGDLSIVQSKKNANAGFFNYAKNFTYTAAGAVTTMQLGNGKWESTQFNSRLQPTQIALGTVQNATDKLKLNFTYNTSGQNDNNGNVLSQTITVPTVGATAGFTAVQTYSYDALNRLKSATENIDGNPTPEWKQTFTYDRYGNRNFDTNGTNTTTIPQGCAVAVCNPQIDPATNKLVGYQFDNAGNTKVDAENRTFIYDGENKQVEVKDQYGVSIGKYFYDGDGKRVKKISNTETTVFVYNAGGQLVAEYSTQTSQTPTVSYLTDDHLGSPRINTDQNGAVIARHDYQPFGEEIQRASYGADAVRKQFTSYERDIESDLDFAQARYYSNQLGRFSSPDDFVNDTRVSDPQSWNLYVYAKNNPLIFVDPTGEEVWIYFEEKDEEGRTVQNRVRYMNGKLYKKDGDKFVEYTGSNDYAKKVLNDLNQLKTDDGDVKSVIEKLEGSEKTVWIRSRMCAPGDCGDAHTPDSQEDARKGIPTGSVIQYDPDGKFIGGGKETGPARINLAHEISHAFDANQGITDYGLTDNKINLREAKAVWFENKVRNAVGIAPRLKYAFQIDPKYFQMFDKQFEEQKKVIKSTKP